MGGERLKIILSLTPPLLIIFTLFFGGIFYGFLQSLGYQPAIGKYELNFSAYYNDFEKGLSKKASRQVNFSSKFKKNANRRQSVQLRRKRRKRMF